MNAMSCVHMSREVLDPFIEEHYSTGLVFQQDGAAAHTAKFTHKYFMKEEIYELQ